MEILFHALRFIVIVSTSILALAHAMEYERGRKWYFLVCVFIDLAMVWILTT